MLLTRSLAAVLFAAAALAGCKGVSTVRVVTNGPATVAVEGQEMGAAPVAFPLPWRSNGLDGVNYASRRVVVTAEGKAVFDRDISPDVADKSRTGDYTDGSQYGYGRTYTLNVDVHATPKNR